MFELLCYMRAQAVWRNNFIGSSFSILCQTKENLDAFIGRIYIACGRAWSALYINTHCWCDCWHACKVLYTHFQLGIEELTALQAKPGILLRFKVWFWEFLLVNLYMIRARSLSRERHIYVWRVYVAFCSKCVAVMKKNRYPDKIYADGYADFCIGYRYAMCTLAQKHTCFAITWSDSHKDA